MQVHESILFHIFKEMGYRMQYHFCSHWSYICFIKRKMSDYFGHSIRSYTFAVNLQSLLLYFSLLCIRLILIYMARYCFSHFFFFCFIRCSHLALRNHLIILGPCVWLVMGCWSQDLPYIFGSTLSRKCSPKRIYWIHWRRCF